MFNFSHYWGSLLDIPQVFWRHLTNSEFSELSWLYLPCHSLHGSWQVACGMCSVPRFGRKQRPCLLLSTPAFLPHVCSKTLSISGATVVHLGELHANCSHLSSVFETSKTWFPSPLTPGKSTLDFVKQSQEERQNCGLPASDDFGVGGWNKRSKLGTMLTIKVLFMHSASPVIYSKGSTYMH